MNAEKRAVYRLLESFTEDLEKNTFHARESIFDPEVVIRAYTTGVGTGPEAADRLLCYPGPKADVAKQNVENVILRVSGDIAKISCHVLKLYAVGTTAERFHYVQYGGTYVLTCRRGDGAWSITEILYDLCWIDGNSNWVNRWKMIDFSMPKRHQQVISAHDSPIYLPNSEQCLETTNERLGELMLLYGWVIDTQDYNLLFTIASPNFTVSDGYHQCVFRSVEAWANFLRELNEKEPCLHHTYRIDSITVNGDTAVGRMSRLEPNRIGSKAIGSHNYFMDFFSLDYTVIMVKESGSWRIQTVDFVRRMKMIPAAEKLCR